jgi:hypothetical protein
MFRENQSTEKEGDIGMKDVRTFFGVRGGGTMCGRSGIELLC